MAKKTLNITQFDGGRNSKYDPRDIEVGEIADAINDVAEDLALVHYDKPLAELEEHERKEIILIAENEVLGI